MDSKQLFALRALLLVALPVFAISVPASSAHALTISGGSVDLAQACTNPACVNLGTDPVTFTLGSGGSASGTLTTDGTTISVALTINVFDLGSTSLPDLGVDELVFSNMTYTASLAHTAQPGGFSGVGSANVTGSLTQLDDIGGVVVAATPLNLAPTLDVNCQETAPSVLKCGVTVLGPTFEISVGNPGQPRWVPHTIDITAVPEPSLLVMGLTVGLLGIPYVRRPGRG